MNRRPLFFLLSYIKLITPEEQAVSVSFGNLPDASVLIWKAREIVGNQSERETRGSSTAVRDSDGGV